MMSLSSTHRRPIFYAKHEVMFCSSSDGASAKWRANGFASKFVRKSFVSGGTLLI